MNCIGFSTADKMAGRAALIAHTVIGHVWIYWVAGFKRPASAPDWHYLTLKLRHNKYQRFSGRDLNRRPLGSAPSQHLKLKVKLNAFTHADDAMKWTCWSWQRASEDGEGTEFEGTVNVVNAVVGARRAAGLGVWQTAADQLGFSPHHNHLQGFQRMHPTTEMINHDCLRACGSFLFLWKLIPA